MWTGPAESSRTRSEIAVAPRSRPKWGHIRSAPRIRGSPSRSALTRQPPSRATGMDVGIMLHSGSEALRVADRKTLGIEVTNQAYTRYDQVEKRQEYHLAEADHQEAFDEDFKVRTCDVG